jgi:hypothetical protein
MRFLVLLPSLQSRHISLEVSTDKLSCSVFSASTDHMYSSHSPETTVSEGIITILIPQCPNGDILQLDKKALFQKVRQFYSSQVSEDKKSPRISRNLPCYPEVNDMET